MKKNNIHFYCKHIKQNISNHDFFFLCPKKMAV